MTATVQLRQAVIGRVHNYRSVPKTLEFIGPAKGQPNLIFLTP